MKKVGQHAPSPWPAPPGGGEAFAELSKACDWTGRMRIQRPENVQRLFPLLGGEGQGEGGRHTIFQNDPSSLVLRTFAALALLACGVLDTDAAKIDRHALVARHNIVITNADPLTPVSVGNGEFAFTADITGLQTFEAFHEKGMLLSTMSQWGWHSFPNPENYVLKDVLVNYDTHGRQVPYADGPIDDEKGEGRSARSKAANSWLRANPHRLDLARIGFVLTQADGTTAHITNLTRVSQRLDLWSGILTSEFSLEGKLVKVQTLCHPERDLMAVRVESALLTSKQAQVRIAFPYATGEWMKAADWNRPERHETQMAQAGQRLDFRRIMDDTRYSVSATFSDGFSPTKTGTHEYTLGSSGETGATVLELVVSFTPEPVKSLPAFKSVQSDSTKHWKKFWQKGGAIDLSGSTDPRWFELERRIVRSQFLTAIHSAGSVPPQETGLVENSWFGKPHLEMHWWHAAHFPLWEREELLERSMGWYQKILPQAHDLARSQGYVGARWPKMIDATGTQSPSSIAVFLIWQQPHPIYFAELLRRAKPGKATMKQYSEVVFESAEFMADYAVWDREGKRYVLGPPLVPAQESYGKMRATVMNPTYELAYWEWALNVAQEWREALGLPRVLKWDDVAKNLAKPTVKDGVYAAIETPPYTVPHDHPSMLCAFGVLPPTSLIDEGTMRKTLDHVWQVWDWPTTWGWDYPVIAMTAARVGEPERAIDALLIDTPKNGYLANGHNYQRPNLPLYLPGNGGLLYATAMMAVGWDGAPQRHAPGFPEKGWVVRYENLRTAP
jgi:hypothetical protein